MTSSRDKIKYKIFSVVNLTSALVDSERIIRLSREIPTATTDISNELATIGDGYSEENEQENPKTTSELEPKPNSEEEPELESEVPSPYTDIEAQQEPIAIASDEDDDEETPEDQLGEEIDQRTDERIIDILTKDPPSVAIQERLHIKTIKQELREQNNILNENYDHWRTMTTQVESLNFNDKVLINRINDTINERLRETIDEAVKTQPDELSENLDFITRVEKIFTENLRITEYLNTQINKMVTTAIQTNFEDR